MPVYEYVRIPGVPPVSVLRFSSDQLPAAHATGDHAHAHNFLVLAYFEQGRGSLWLGGRHWPLNAGDAFVIAPGEAVRLGELLRETDLTVEAVAARVGYRQPSYFIKHFRRDHTVTPAAWWRRTRASLRDVTPRPG